MKDHKYANYMLMYAKVSYLSCMLPLIWNSINWYSLAQPNTPVLLCIYLYMRAQTRAWVSRTWNVASSFSTVSSFKIIVSRLRYKPSHRDATENHRREGRWVSSCRVSVMISSSNNLTPSPRRLLLLSRISGPRAWPHITGSISNPNFDCRLTGIFAGLIVRPTRPYPA